MKASELIEKLQKHVNDGDDLEVFTRYNDPEMGLISFEVGDPEIEGTIYAEFTRDNIKMRHINLY
jgi:hypothetical protein